MQPSPTIFLITFFIVDVTFIVCCFLVVVDVLLILHKELVEILASIVVGSVVNDLFAQAVLQSLHRFLPRIVIVKVGVNVPVLAQQVCRFPQVDDGVEYKVVHPFRTTECHR